MKKAYCKLLKIVFSFACLLLLTEANAATTNYYPRLGNTDLSIAAQWTTSVNGIGGVSPANFIAPQQVFNITGVTNASPTIAANWIVSGAGSSIFIGDGMNAVNFIIPPTYMVTGLLTNITANATLTISNAPSISSITWPADIDPESTVDFLNLGNFTIPILTALVNGYGNIILDNSSVNNVMPANLFFAGDLTLQNAASLNSTFLSLNLRGGATQTISGNTLTLTVDNFIDTLKTSGSVILAANTPINFNKDLWLNQAVTNRFIDGGNTLSCLGNLNMNGVAPGYNLTGTIILAGNQGPTPQKLGDDNQYASPGAIVAALNNVVINCNNPVQFMTNSTPASIIINGDFQVTSSGFHPIILCTTRAVTGWHTFNFLGNFANYQNLNLSFDTTTSYTFDGTSGQNLTSVMASETFTNLTINDSAGVTLSAPFNISGILTLQNGIVYIKDTANKLTLLKNASCPSGGSAASYIDGAMAKTGTTPFEFPIGNSNRFMPLGIASSVAGLNTVTAQYTYSMPANLYSVNYPLANVSTLEYWTISESNPKMPENITLYWQNAASSGIYNYDSTLRVAEYAGGITAGAWYDLGNAGISITSMTSGSVLSSAQISSFSNMAITFGSTNSNSNPLPITLTSFNATYIAENNSVLTDWSVASQLNNNEFVVEKTTDGINYTQVGTLPGAGTTPFAQSYSLVDNNPIQGVSYYRLKQIDMDGNSTEFSPVAVYDGVVSTSSITVYPNPVMEIANINYISEDSRPITISIYDLSGRVIGSTQFTQVVAGINNFSLNTSGLSSGIYLLQIANSQKSFYQKILKQ
jgi:hypothetical protein